MGDRSSAWIDFPRRSSLLRWLVFCAAFGVAAIASLTYDYSRPAEYRAVTRLQIFPALGVGEAGQVSGPALKDQPQSFLTEVEVLTSRPLLQEAINRIQRDEGLPDLGADPVGAVKQMLHAEPVPGTQVVQLAAEGPERELVTQLANTVAATYRDQVMGAYKQNAESMYANLTDEVESLQRRIVTKRTEVEAYRERNDIVSLERQENSVLASVQDLSRSVATGNESLAKAQGRVQALTSSDSGAGAAVSNKDDPTVAAIEQRASALREQLTDLRRRFTSDYLALDPETRSLEQRIAALDEQAKTQRALSQQTAIAAAKQELSTSQEAVNRLNKDLKGNEQKARQFAARLSEFKVMEDDLEHLQTMERAASDRLTRMQASERERAPKVDIVELAVRSVAPWRPDYTRDAAIAIAGSVAFGLFAVWLMGFLSEPALARVAMGVPISDPNQLTLPTMGGIRPQAPALANEPKFLELPSRIASSRELDDSELAALLSNEVTDDVRLLTVALLSGLSPKEIVSLEWKDVEFESSAIDIKGDAARLLSLEEPFASLLKERRYAEEGVAAKLFHDDRGNPLTTESLDNLLVCSACDAGLHRPEEITAMAVRQAYLMFLIRSGIRTSDIARVAGNVPHAELVAYTRLSEPRVRVPLDKINHLHPSLRRIFPLLSKA